MSKIPLAIISRDFADYDVLYATGTALHKHYDLIYLGPDQNSAQCKLAKEKAVVMLSEPDLASRWLNQCPSLKWLQSSWAGNNALQQCDFNNKTLTGVKGIFGPRMTEYVLAYILYFHRNIEQYTALKRHAKWQQIPVETLCQKTLGIMGIGHIGTEVAKAAQLLGLNILGYATHSKTIPDISVYASEHLHKFASQCDYIVNLLPDTNKTQGLCNKHFFAALKPTAVFINAGRGSVIDKAQTLIDALNNGQIRAAVLDVFEQEPLPPSHPFYQTSNLHISCHTAAHSEPRAVFEVFCSNAERFVQNKKLHYIHDFNKGY